MDMVPVSFFFFSKLFLIQQLLQDVQLITTKTRYKTLTFTKQQTRHFTPPPPPPPPLHLQNNKQDTLFTTPQIESYDTRGRELLDMTNDKKKEMPGGEMHYGEIQLGWSLNKGKLKVEFITI